MLNRPTDAAGRSLFAAAAAVLLCLPTVWGVRAIGQQPAENEKAPPPSIAMSVPLAVPAGATTKLLVRGWNLAEASQLRSADPRVTVKILNKGAANVPGGQDAKLIGDTQLELELIVPEGVEPGEVELIAIAPSGDSMPYRLLVGSRHPAADDTEPNDGFQQAREIQLPQVIDGQIHADRNVDVFSFELAAEQHLSIEVHARRRGSGLDSRLVLYDHQGNTIAVSDDRDDTVDSRIDRKLPAGNYYLSLQDAQDRGGPAHPYRLVVRTMP